MIDNTLYVVRDSMGSYLCPKGYPSHSYRVKGTGQSMNLDYALTQDYVPAKVKRQIKALIRSWKLKNPDIDPIWEQAVYNHMNHCYYVDDSHDGNTHVVYGDFWNNKDQEINHSPDLHYAVVFIRGFYPDYVPNISLMNRGS